VRVGDLLFIRNRQKLGGIGRISRIEEGEDTKTFKRCPVCNASRLQRRTGSSSFRCSNGHEFEEPVELRQPIKTFRAHFDGSFFTLNRGPSADELKPFQLRNSTQLAIMPADLAGLIACIARRAPESVEALVSLVGEVRPLEDHEAEEELDLTPSGIDERTIIVKEFG
jgi:putative restriction endonuclease